jgi:cytochrome c-type biogenesis protein CcmF
MEALDDRRTVVGAPYVDRLSLPIGIALLFLMAVAPVLPWRKASQELLRDRLFWPAWCGALALGVAVAAGADGWASLAAFGLAGFAAGSALRQLALATRRQGWRGLLGRANGGMIVHLGVIVIAVALVASNAYTKSAEITLQAGQPVTWEGHTFELVDVTSEQTERANVVRANVQLDGGNVYGPAITTYLKMGVPIGTPSVRAGLTGDVYMTIAGNRPPEVGGSEVHLEVFLKPLVIWICIGGLMMVVGTLLAAIPGNRRRRPIDPVSAPVPEMAREVEVPVG